MNNKLSIQDLVSAMTDRYGMDAKATTAFVKTVFEIVEEYISQDKLVKIKGLGTFKLVNVSDRESINVNTGERILIAGHSKLSFTPDTALKDAVNRPFADFETTVLRESTSTEDMERIPATIQADNADDTRSEDDTEVKERLPHEQTVGVETRLQELALEDEQHTVVEDSLESVAVAPGVERSEPVATTESKKENTAYPMAAESISVASENKSSSWGWLYALLTLLLMAGAYLAGYYRIHDKLHIDLSPESEVKEQPIVKPTEKAPSRVKPAVADSVTHGSDSIEQGTDTVASTATTTAVSSSVSSPTNPQVVDLQGKDPAEVAKGFPQVPNGEYWIVGDAGRVHYMAVGETLYRIAKKELGSQDFVKYLIVFNDFDDPNVIHKGDPIRIPVLVKK